MIEFLRTSIYRSHNPIRQFTTLLGEACSGNHVRVLDIGCGARTPTLNGLGGQRYGVDLVDSFMPGAGVHTARASADSLPFPSNAFDLVYCQSVIEHLEHPSKMFSEVARVLKPGGSFMILTPNRWDYVSLAASVIPNQYHPVLVKRLTKRPEEDTFPTLYRANTGRRLRRLAREHAFVVDRLSMCRQHPHYLQVNLPLYLAGVLFEQCVQRPIPWLRPWILAVFRPEGGREVGQ